MTPIQESGLKQYWTGVACLVLRFTCAKRSELGASVRKRSKDSPFGQGLRSGRRHHPPVILDRHGQTSARLPGGHDRTARAHDRPPARPGAASDAGTELGSWLDLGSAEGSAAEAAAEVAEDEDEEAEGSEEPLGPG